MRRGTLVWLAAERKAGDWAGSTGEGGGARRECRSIPCHPVSKAERIIQVRTNARTLLLLCFSVSELRTPSPTNFRSFLLGRS